MIYLHSANSQNLYILGTIEILAKTRPTKMGGMVTLGIIQWYNSETSIYMTNFL